MNGYARRKLRECVFGRGFDYRHLHQKIKIRNSPLSVTLSDFVFLYSKNYGREFCAPCLICVLSHFTELGRCVFDDSQCIFHTFLCVTDCDKASVRLQDGETDAYKWVTEKDFIAFVNSDKMIERQKKRYSNYFAEKGYIL